MKTLLALLCGLLFPRVATAQSQVYPQPLPLTPTLDGGAIGMVLSLAQNVAYQIGMGYGVIATTATIAGNFQALYPGFVVRTTAPTSNIEVMPSTAQLLADPPNTAPRDGSCQFVFRYINQGTGQTITLTAGDASTTMTGTMTVATNTWRDILVTMRQNAGTVEMTNIGAGTL